MEIFNIELEMTENKESIRTKQLIIHELAEIFEAYPQYPIAQHLNYLTDKKNSWKFTNDELLKQIQKYRGKLEDEILEGDEEYFEDYLNE